MAAAVLEDNRRLVAVDEPMREMLGLEPGGGVGTDFGGVLAKHANGTATAGLSTVYRFGQGSQSRWYRLDLKALEHALIGILTDVGQEYEPQEEVRVYQQARDRLLLDGKIGTWHYDPDI